MPRIRRDELVTPLPVKPSDPKDLGDRSDPHPARRAFESEKNRAKYANDRETPAQHPSFLANMLKLFQR